MTMPTLRIAPFIIAALTALAGTASAAQPTAPTLAPPTPPTTLPRPTPQQLTWHDLELGMFIHIAPQTWQDSESDDGSTPLASINPDKLDTDQWVAVAESMGAKYIVFVAKHEGGFCWWPTTSTSYSVAGTPWRAGKGDVMKDLAASCAKRSMKLGVYISPQDRKHGIEIGGKAKDPAKQAEYQTMFRTQLTELLTSYGPIMEVWFDGSLVFDVGDILAKHAPRAVVFQGPHASIRWVGNEDGLCPDPGWNTVKFGIKKWGDYTAADGDPAGDRWLPNECDARMRATWFWRTDNQKTIKSIPKLMEMYEKSVGHGAVLLINNTPDRTGLIPAPDAARAAEFGQAITLRYGTPLAMASGDGASQAVTLPAGKPIDRAIIMEDIAEGERIRAYEIQGLFGETWRTLSSGTAVGHKKIDTFAPASPAAVRLRITSSAAPPRVIKLAVFQQQPAEK